MRRSQSPPNPWSSYATSSLASGRRPVRVRRPACVQEDARLEESSSDSDTYYAYKLLMQASSHSISRAEHFTDMFLKTNCELSSSAGIYIRRTSYEIVPVRCLEGYEHYAVEQAAPKNHDLHRNISWPPAQLLCHLIVLHTPPDPSARSEA